MRKRRLFDDSIELIDVEWRLTEDEFDAFKRFFEADLEQGSFSFAIETLEWSTESLSIVPDEVVREVSFWGANYSFSRSDNLFAVSATLEVASEDRVVHLHHIRELSDSIGLNDSLTMELETGGGNGGNGGGEEPDGSLTDALTVFDGVVGSLGDTIIPDDNPQKETNGWIYRPSHSGIAYLNPQHKVYDPIGEIILTSSRLYAAITDIPLRYYDMHWNQWYNLNSARFIYRRKFGPYGTDVMFRVDYENVYSLPTPTASNGAESWFYFYNEDPGWNPYAPPDGVAIQTDLPRIRRKIDHVQGLDIHGDPIYETEREDQWLISSDPNGYTVVTDITSDPNGSTEDFFEFQLDEGEYLWAVVILELGGHARPYARSYWDFNFSQTPV